VDQLDPMTTEERYCDNPHCLRPVDPLTPGDELAVHPKARAPELGSAFTPVTVGEQIWRIHPGCFSASRHVRA
jgi:hypothetical protein